MYNSSWCCCYCCVRLPLLLLFVLQTQGLFTSFPRRPLRFVVVFLRLRFTSSFQFGLFSFYPACIIFLKTRLHVLLGLRWSSSSRSCASSWWSANGRNHPSAKDRRLVTPMIMMNFQVSSIVFPGLVLLAQPPATSWYFSIYGFGRSAKVEHLPTDKTRPRTRP